MGRESTQPIQDREDHCGRVLQVYKKGEDPSAPGFQKGDEVRKENLITEFHSLFPEKRESVSAVGDCGEKRDWPVDLSESNEALYSRIFSPP